MADKEKKKGGKGKLLGGVGALAVVGAALYFFVLGGGGGEEAAGAETTTTVATEGAVIEAGELTVNLADEGEPRYARVNFAVVLAMGADSGVVGERVPLLQDAALSVLTGYTSDDLRGPAGLDDVRTELTERAQEIYPDGEVMRVVLTELIVQ